MLPYEVLNKVKKIVAHKNCPDGIASAMILKDILSNAEVQFIQYNTDEHRNLVAEPGLLFCDFTPDPARIQQFVDAGTIVLDHHKGGKGIVEQFGELGVFADEKLEPGVSGALLAYREVYLPLFGPDTLVEDFARLAGIRDTWQTSSPFWNDSCEQASWLMFFGEDLCLEAPIFPRGLNAESKWEFRQEIGKMMFADHMRKIAKTVNGAFLTSIQGLRVAIHQGVNHTSDATEMLGEESKVDVLVGFSYFAEGQTTREPWSPQFGDNLKMVCSCRTRTSFDVSKLAKFYGGGGHTKAAGFTLPVEGAHSNPYTRILELIENYLASQNGQTKG